MNDKPAKSPPVDSKNAARKADVDAPADEDVIKNTVRPVREGPENLRQRAAWFRRRTGGEK
jgi:hypothetical protein